MLAATGRSGAGRLEFPGLPFVQARARRRERSPAPPPAAATGSGAGSKPASKWLSRLACPHSSFVSRACAFARDRGAGFGLMRQAFHWNRRYDAARGRRRRFAPEAIANDSGRGTVPSGFGQWKRATVVRERRIRAKGRGTRARREPEGTRRQVASEGDRPWKPPSDRPLGDRYGAGRAISVCEKFHH